MNVTATAPDFGNVFVAIALVILPLAALAPLGIAWGAAAPALWVALLYWRAGQPPWAGRSWALPAALTGLVAYGAVTVFWSIAPDRTADIAIRLVPVVAGGWLLTGAAARLDRRARARTATALLIGGALTVALIGIEIATGGLIQGLLRGQGLTATGGLIHLNRAASQIAILIWPLWLVLDRRFGPAVAAAAIGVAVLLLFALDPDTPLMTVAAGVPFLLLAYAAPRLTRSLMIIGVVVVALAIPFYPVILPIVDDALVSWDLGDFTLRHRFAIWEFAATRVAEQPVFGWGLGVSRVIPGADDIAVQLGAGAQSLPLHPHNALLQLWLELGIPGVALGLFTIVTVLVAITRHIRGRKEMAAALTVVFSAIMIAELSYGIWQSWWLVFLWVIAALTIALAGPSNHREPS